MIVADPAGGVAGAGFAVPQGDPGELRSAASQWSTLEHALESAKSSVVAASERTLDSGGWTGGTAAAFTAHATIIVGALTGGIEAAMSASTALDTLATELEHVQSVTRAALVDYSSALHTYTTQSAAATSAGNTASEKETQAAGTTHPTAKSDLNQQAASARQDERTANDAANTASGDMTSASTRGSGAVTAYDTAVARIETTMLQAAGAFIDIPDGGSWEELALRLIDDALTFSGGLTFVGRSFEAQFASGVKVMDKEMNRWRAAADSAIDHGEPLPKPVTDDPDQFDRITKARLNDEAVDGNAWLKLLSRGWTDDDGVVSKVPVVAQLLTGFEIYENFHDHEGPLEAIGEPVANLAAGTVVAEVASTGLAIGIAAAQAADIPILTAVVSTSWVPGVGEVVIVGVVTVAAVYGLDKLGTYVWDHPDQAAHDVTSSPVAPVLAADPVTAPVVAAAWTWEHKDQIAHDASSAAGGIAHVATGAWHDATHPVSTIKSLAHDIGL